MTAENKWTYDRPAASGYYWVSVYGSPEVAYVDHFGGKFLVSLMDEEQRDLSECNGWRWWPVPIEAPPEPEPHGAEYVGP